MLSQPCPSNERRKLEQFIEENSEEASQQRALAVLNLYQGYTPAQVAANLGFKPKTIRAWRRRFRAEGIEGLADRPRSGRPLKGDKHYQQVLEEALASDPEDLGLGFMTWSVQRLRIHMERQTGIALSEGRLRLLLKRLGYRYQRYTRRTPNPNPPSLKRWQGTSLETFVNALFAVRRQSLWGWKRPPG